MLVFCAERKTGKPGEKPSGQGREPTTNSTHWARFECGPYWREVSSLASAPSCDKIGKQTQAYMTYLFKSKSIEFPNVLFNFHYLMTEKKQEQNKHFLACWADIITFLVNIATKFQPFSAFNFTWRVKPCDKPECPHQCLIQENNTMNWAS